MNKIKKIKALLNLAAVPSSDSQMVFFKTGAGHYAEHDRFIGVSVPAIRKIAKEFFGLELKQIQILLESSFNEERLLALILLVNQYQKADLITKQQIYDFYLHNLQYVNNWNLVDVSAHLILGAHLYKGNKNVLLHLAKSKILWERRISIVATLYFIRQQDLNTTYKISKLLINDQHDLIHKAVGWMLREAGKRDKEQLLSFLDRYATKMPRTMLRYAIEKFPERQRKAYLAKKA